MIARIRHVASLADPKYLPMMALPMLVPYAAYGPMHGWTFAGGVLAVVVLNFTAVIVNMWSDREADQINFPAGAAAIDRHLGYHRLPAVMVGCYALLLLASYLMWTRYSPDLSVVYTTGWLIATAYSVGPRLKRNLVASRLCIAMGPTLAFAGGVALHRPLSTIPAPVVVLFVAQGIHILLKDLPDADGDRRMGVRTLFTGVAPEKLRRLLPALWAAPAIVATIGALAGAWGLDLLLLWLLYPLALTVTRAPFVAHSQAEKELVRELAQAYSTIFVLTWLVLVVPAPSTWILCGAGVVLYVAVLASGLDRRRQDHRVRGLASFVAQIVRSYWTVAPRAER